MFKQIVAVSGAVALASAAYNATSTVSQNTTTLVTITSCEDNACHLTTSPALVSIATVTVEGTVTEYTTYCPLTSTSTFQNTTILPTSLTTTKGNATVSSEFTNAAAKALPAAGALIAGAAALLL